MDDGLGIWRNTPNPEAAWKFLKFLTSKQGQDIMIKQQSLAPTRRSALPAYQELSKTHNLGVILESMMDAQMVITSRTAGDIRKISDTIGYNILVPALRQNKQPYEVLAKATKPAIEQILKETAK
jgi:ABC-type glycerol-3-phosphate transport system substrate-binding protein